jgi:hypothetical protein
MFGAVGNVVFLATALLSVIVLAWLIIYHLRGVKRLVLLTTTLLPLILPAWLIICHVHLKSGFAHIEHGTPAAEVVQTLGEPNGIFFECGHFGGKPPAGCVREFSYLSILAFTDVWVVSFDANDQAVRKYRYRSP